MSPVKKCLSFLMSPSRYRVYPWVSVDGTGHVGFNNHTIYTLQFFATVWIVLLITGVISATFYNCSCWNKNRGPCLKYGMTWRRNRLHKYRRQLMESVAEIVLVKSEELTSRRWTSSGKLLSLGEGNDLGNVLNAAFTRRFSLRVSSKNSDSGRHVSWCWCRSNFDHYT